MQTQHQTLSSPHSRRPLLALCVLAAAATLGGRLSAQTAAPDAPTPAAAAPADPNVVKLSTFTVTSSQDQGYRASNSIAGTRSNTPIRDIPLNIQVFTKDLSDDLVINSQVELERYNAALVNGGFDVRSDNTIQQAYNSFLFRGFIQNWGLRDGIREYDPVDTQGLARVEIVKGPAAPLYGLTYPGGVMNGVTKEVDFSHSFGALRGTVQSYGELRGTIDANIVGDAGSGKVGVRFNAAEARTEDDRAHSRGSLRYTQTNAAWRPFASTEVKLLVESGYRAKPNNLGYFSTGELGANGQPLGNGADIPLQVTHPNIPWTWNWSDGINRRSLDTHLYRGTATQAVGDNLVVTGYFQYSDRTQIDSNGWDAAGGGGSAASWDMTFGTLGTPATGWLNPNTPQERIVMGYHYRDWDNSMHAYGATAVYKLDTSVIRNTFTLGANAWSEHFLTHKSIQPGGTTNLISFPVAANIDTIHTPFAPPQDYYADVAGAYGHESNSNDYYFASWQGYLLNDKLKINAAINHTHLKLLQWASGAATTPNNTTAKQDSPMIGVLYDLTKEISLFAVHSSSLFPTTDKNSFSVQMPPVKGKSNEAGVKIELLDGKVSGTISYYEITQTGGSQYNPAAENFNTKAWDSMTPAQQQATWPGKSRTDLLGDYVPGAEQKSKGLDADLIFQPLPSWQILFSYAHNDEKVTSAVDQTSIGQSTPGHIKDQWSALTKYSFLHGPAKGLFIGAGLQSSARALQGYQSGVARFNPSTFYLEAFAGYRFKAFGYRQSIQLNGKNLTKQDDFVGWQPTGSASVVATQRYRVPTVARWSLTYGLDF